MTTPRAKPKGIHPSWPYKQSRPLPHGRRVRVCGMVDYDIVRHLDAAAKRCGLSRTAFMEAVLREAIERGVTADVERKLPAASTERA